MSHCIAFKQADIGDSIVYVPCLRPTKKTLKNKRIWERRFCPSHDQAYREILLGIIMQGSKKEKL